MSTIDHPDFKNVHGKPVHRVIRVTGATGNVGRPVVTPLLRTGAVVRAIPEKRPSTQRQTESPRQSVWSPIRRGRY